MKNSTGSGQAKVIPLFQRRVSEKRGPDAIAEWIWSPLALAALTLIPGAIGMATGQPFLFPSLGPSAYLQAASPHLPSARFVPTLLGQLIGMLAGFAAVALTRAAAQPSLFAAQPLTWPRVGAAVLSVLLMMAGQMGARVKHPPAAATALLIALGGFPLSWPAARALVIGIGITAVTGEALRRLRLAQPGQK